MYLGFGDLTLPEDDPARPHAIALPSPTPFHLYPNRSLDEQVHTYPPGIPMYHSGFSPSDTVSELSHHDHHEDARSISITSTHTIGPLTVFGHSTKEKVARKIYFRVLIGGSLLIIVSIFTIFSIYWGALWDTTNHVHNIVGWAVDFDGGDIGQAVIPFFEAARSQAQITWIVKDASDFPNGPDDLAEAVRRHDCWVALSVNPLASSNLTAALSSVNPSYNGSLAITAYGNEARNENGYRAIFSPQMQLMLQAVTTKYNMQMAQKIASSDKLADLLAQSPQTVLQPVFYSLINLHPFNIPVASAVTFVGLIYLVILSFMTTMISLKARISSGYENQLGLVSLIKLRLVSSIVLYFFISLFYALLSAAFQVSFNRVFGRSGFLIFWMLQWCGMLALGLALDAMLTLLTAGFVPFFMVLWIISNVSVSSMPIELLPGIFKYGYASPFFNLNEATRTILFGIKNQLGLNFGVLIAWIAISICSQPLFIWFTRRKMVKSANLEAANKRASRRISKAQTILENQSEEKPHSLSDLNQPRAL